MAEPIDFSDALLRSDAVARRYGSSYRAADALILVGRVIKLLSLVITTIAILFCIALAVKPDATPPLNAAVGVVFIAVWTLLISFSIYVIGAIVLALGHFLRLKTDSVVLENKFLSDDAKFKLMSATNID
jgi:hypothetical protein